MKTVTGKFAVWTLAGAGVFLSGCATPPQWLADHYDSQDLCQRSQVIDYGGIRLVKSGSTLVPELTPAQTTQARHCQGSNQLGRITDIQGRTQYLIKK